MYLFTLRLFPWMFSRYFLWNTYGMFLILLSTNIISVMCIPIISRVLSWIKTYTMSFAGQAVLPYQWQLETNLCDELMLSKPQLITITHKPTTTLITHIGVTAITEFLIVLGNFKWMVPAADAVMTQKRFPDNLWGGPTGESTSHICGFSTQSNTEPWFFVLCC